VVSDRRVLAEFDDAYPRFVVAAHRAIVRFYRYDHSRVEDAVAETLARTFERWERVRKHDNPTGWVVVCAKNVCLEQLRAENRAQRARTVLGPRASSQDHADATVQSDALYMGLAALSKRQRDVAVLRYLMDYDEATTAMLLGTSVSKVKTAAHEARQRLRVLLTDLAIEPDDVAS
jgi:RNA polymerase sigma factor (sigma-70 family)